MKNEFLLQDRYLSARRVRFRPRGRYDDASGRFADRPCLGRSLKFAILFYGVIWKTLLSEPNVAFVAFEYRNFADDVDTLEKIKIEKALVTAMNKTRVFEKIVKKNIDPAPFAIKRFKKDCEAQITKAKNFLSNGEHHLNTGNKEQALYFFKASTTLQKDHIKCLTTNVDLIKGYLYQIYIYDTLGQMAGFYKATREVVILDPQVTVNEKFFPKHTIDRFERIRKKMVSAWYATLQVVLPGRPFRNGDKDPDEADIYINGKRYRSNEIAVVSGEPITVLILKKGYPPYTERVHIAPGEKKQIHPKLVPYTHYFGNLLRPIEVPSKLTHTLFDAVTALCDRVRSDILMMGEIVYMSDRKQRIGVQLFDCRNWEVSEKVVREIDTRHTQAWIPVANRLATCLDYRGYVKDHCQKSDETASSL